MFECLYKVVHTLDSVNAIKPVLVMGLHQCLRHIMVNSARKLVTSGTIIGVNLDMSSLKIDYDTCIYACAIRLAIPKVRISPPAQNF